MRTRWLGQAPSGCGLSIRSCAPKSSAWRHSRYNIRRVRLSKNFYSSGQPLPAGLLWKKRTYNWALKSIYRTRTTDAFTELITYYRADAGRKRSTARIELMVHPGAAAAAEETAILESDWIARTDPPVRLISYAQLA